MPAMTSTPPVLLRGLLLGLFLHLGLLLLHPTPTSALLFGAGSARATLKTELLRLSEGTGRGATAPDDVRHDILAAFERLERLNPTPRPLRSSLLPGTWELRYTTSASISGGGRWDLPRVGPILQILDPAQGTAINAETLDLLGMFRVPRSVRAELDPRSDQLTAVRFRRFEVGPLGFPAPEKFVGSLDVTYLDEDFRLTRGDRGNLFVLTRAVN